MAGIFLAIYNYFDKHKAILWLTAIASFLAVGFFASQIKIEEDITRILPHEQKLDKLQQVFQDSRFSDMLTVTFSQKDSTKEANPDSLGAFAEAFSEIANGKLASHIKQIKGKADDSTATNLVEGVQMSLPIFLSKKDYDTIDSLISPARIRSTLEYDYNTLISPSGFVLKKIIQADPVGITWIGIKKLRNIDDQYDQYDGYIMTRDHRNLQIFITPANPANATAKNTKFFEELDATLDSLQKAFPGVEASYFGAAAVSAGNAAQIRADTYLTQGITVTLLIIFIGLYFRKKRAPILIMLPVIFGALFSLAMVYLIDGHISVVALGAGSIVLGIAVNSSLHIFNHHKHLADMRKVIADVASPMTIGSFTTIGGFLCLLFVPSPLLNDLGLFAAFSLVGATLCSLIFLPHWITIGSNAKNVSTEHKLSWLDKLSALKPERNKYLIGSIFLLTIVFFYTAKNVGFESDMLRMNYMSPELQEAEKKLNNVNAYTAQSLYLLAEGKTLEEALETNERALPLLQQLKEQGAIKKTSGVGDLLLSQKEQQERINRWNSYWTTEKKQQLLALLKIEGAAYKFSATAFNQFEQLLNKQFTAQPAKEMGLYQSDALNNFILDKGGTVSLVTLIKVDPQQKEIVNKAFDQQPNITLLDRQYAANSLVGEINNEFNNIAWMTGLLVFFALLLSYGRIELTLITFIPMLISWVWILGIMGIFGIKFNIVNIILSTFIFGLGDDYSIFTMDGLLQQYKTGKKHITSFKTSIFLSAITTILGLGILIFAKHPSLRSIALISIIGICCVVMTSQVLIPFFFNWLITSRVKKAQPPWTLSGLFITLFAYTYFVSGSFIVAFFGLILIKLNPFNKVKGKYIYHVILSNYTWSMLHIMGNVKKRTYNPLNEQLDKPALIVSNHQSTLDILVSTALNPKVILLTNKWVWHSPVFGAVVRLADYYPVTDGADDAADRLRQKVKEGYSIMIYPEGTRSVTGEVKRFHKGAFLLAEQLGLDVLPVLIQGTAYTLTKGDFLLKNGEINIKYLPRIKSDDLSWGAGYQERGKSISRYFKQEFEKFRLEKETPKYFREQLIYNYIYKGPVLEWYMRVKTMLEKNYEQFHQLVPQKGKILDLGCGYGFLPYMLHFLAKDRIITGVDYDEEKIDTASHNYMKNDNVNFVYANVVEYSFDQQDAIIINDVLHYLQPDEQEIVIQRCINNIADNGIIILRDGDADKAERHKGTELTEFFSIKAFGFNKSSGKPLSFMSGTRIREIASKYGATVEQIDNTRYTSNIIFVLRKKPITAYA
ncbi:MAG: phospholipid/glycerol acyltransferase [Flavipsychrobacter sp.]|nr:phospholipid/glycerol acyltransferase [Flavipsychrobacter sp.]